MQTGRQGPPTDLASGRPALTTFIEQLGATRVECGATAVAPDGSTATNQCFYLALAAAVAAGHESHHPLASKLHEQIKRAVWAARPNWAAQDFFGAEAGAFADFLTWGLQAALRMRARAVGVYHGEDGTCEISRSQHHTGRHSPLIALWFSGPEAGQAGHYYGPRFRSPTITLSDILTSHRRGRCQNNRTTTFVTDVEG